MRNIDDYTSEYKKDNFEEYEVVYRRKTILNHIEKYQSKKLLEIGCGMAPLFEFMGGYDLYCLIEPSKEFFCFARKLHEKSKGKSRRVLINDFFGKNPEVRKYDYDFIILSSLLHELEDPKEILLNVAEVCNKDTVVHVNVPNANSFHRVLARNMGLISDVHQLTERNMRFQQHTVFDMDDLRKIVKSAGFDVIEEGSYFFKPFTHSQMYTMIKIGIIDEKVLDGLDKMCGIFPDYGAEIYVNCRLSQ